MNKGTGFRFSINTARGMQVTGNWPADGASTLVTSIAATGLEHGVGQVTAGIAALAEFQQCGD